MNSVSFVVYGKPQGKARPRVTKRGTYTPEKTKAYQNEVKASAMRTGASKFDKVPLKATIGCFYQIPKGTSKINRSKMLSGEIAPIVKPDLDNVAKAILDALNGALYDDDNQIVRLLVKKDYSDNPRVEVSLSEWR